jgi:peptide/nickel transport system permease protein
MSTSSPMRLAAVRLRRNPAALVSTAAVLCVALVALLAPVLAPYAPSAQPDPVGLKNLAPSLAHPFGTDAYSRDVLSRVMYGARTSLSIAALSVALSLTIATAYGAAAGFVGGRVDAVMMRVIDVLLAVPRVLLLIAVLTLWRRVEPAALILLLGATGWFGVSRIVRAEVMAAARRDYVLAARALGANARGLLALHVLPNVTSPILVAATLAIGHVIILEAGLSYLGIGVRQPAASWGNLILDGSESLSTAWWISLFPGLALVATVMACNTLGDALRDALDPRQLDGPDPT